MYVQPDGIATALGTMTAGTRVAPHPGTRPQAAPQPLAIPGMPLVPKIRVPRMPAVSPRMQPPTAVVAQDIDPQLTHTLSAIARTFGVG